MVIFAKDQLRLVGICLVQSLPTQNEPRTQFMQNKLNEGQDLNFFNDFFNFSQ
jgi:hypothetical protein